MGRGRRGGSGTQENLGFTILIVVTVPVQPVVLFCKGGSYVYFRKQRFWHNVTRAALMVSLSLFLSAHVCVSSHSVTSDSSETPWTIQPARLPVHRILQARILEWVAISFSKELCNPRIKSASPALAGGFFTTQPPGHG